MLQNFMARTLVSGNVGKRARAPRRGASGTPTGRPSFSLPFGYYPSEGPDRFLIGYDPPRFLVIDIRSTDGVISIHPQLYRTHSVPFMVLTRRKTVAFFQLESPLTLC